MNEKQVFKSFEDICLPIQEREEISDADVFSAYAAVERHLPVLKGDDRDWFLKLRNLKWNDPKPLEKMMLEYENRKRLMEICKKYKDTPTGTYKKVDSLDENRGRLLTPAILKAAHSLGAEEILIFENPIGNSKPVPLIILNGEKFVLKHTGEEYMTNYAKIQAAEHRPEMREVKIDGKLYGLFRFVGDRGMDYTDREQLKQLCEIGIASARRGVEFDPNPGNLLVEDGKVYYIDVALDYVHNPTLAESVVGNIGACMHSLPTIFEKTLYLDSVLFIIKQFHDAFAPIQLQEGETVEGVIQNQIAWFFAQWSNEYKKFFKKFPKDVDEPIRKAIAQLFVQA